MRDSERPSSRETRVCRPVKVGITPRSGQANPGEKGEATRLYRPGALTALLKKVRSGSDAAGQERRHEPGRPGMPPTGITLADGDQAAGKLFGLRLGRKPARTGRRGCSRRSILLLVLAAVAVSFPVWRFLDGRRPTPPPTDLLPAARSRRERARSARPLPEAIASCDQPRGAGPARAGRHGAAGASRVPTRASTETSGWHEGRARLAARPASDSVGRANASRAFPAAPCRPARAPRDANSITAVDLLIEGRHREALVLYEQLAAGNSGQPAYPVIADLLRRRIGERCAGRLSGADRPCRTPD
jgi:hypothetical protein